MKIINNKNKNNFVTLMNDISWEVSLESTVDECYHNFLNTFKNNFNAHFPIKLIIREQVTTWVKWATQGIKISSQTKRKFHVESIWNKDAKCIECFRNYKKIFKWLYTMLRR